MKAFDPALASPFRVDWLVPLDAISQDDYTRAIAEKAEPILRAARFIHAHQGAEPTDMEIRVWVESANAPACVSITWEPGFHAFGFHLLDESLRERLATIVFTELPCIDGGASDQQADDILRAALAAIRDAEERSTPSEIAARVREGVREAGGAGEKSVRVPVVDASARFDHGVEP